MLFPFSAILGQESMKLALLLAAIDLRLGGVLIRGDKGTAKSTAARGLASLLPKDKKGRNAPFVELPLGATEDSVIGSLDLESAIRNGRVAFHPGLLAKAHGGVLYIDEVNLLNDHLVDAVLDAAGSGENRVEREGQSHVHPSRFLLIGTMNPEEGELRPQLLDRFGLAVAVIGEAETSLRVELMRRREAFDADPADFVKSFAAQEQGLAARLAKARERLCHVSMPARFNAFVIEMCQRSRVAGHRADIVLDRAARCHAAWLERNEATLDDILAVAPLVLLHRQRSASPDLPLPPPPPEQPPDRSESETDPQEQNNQPQEDEGQEESDGNDEGDDEMPMPPPSSTAPDKDGEMPPALDDIQPVGATFRTKNLGPSPVDGKPRTGSGRRSRSLSAGRQGRYVKATSKRRQGDLALDATLRAAAPHQRSRRELAACDMAVILREPDFREKIRERRVGNFLLFVVDGSGSMGAQKRMSETKAAIMSLLLDAYQKRDKVAMVVFRGKAAEVVLPPTGSVERAARLLVELPVGGRTPLPEGLNAAARLLHTALRKEPRLKPIVLLLTDGRANSATGPEPAHQEAMKLASNIRDHFKSVRFVVVDTEPQGGICLGLARKLAAALDADYFKTSELKADDLICLAKENQAT